ncbi:MAG: glutamate--cysteine ligase, partial [Mycobacterium sp.]|nr:glutamate--cysteine ligase [Mycobacterium sp.]
DEIGVDLFGAGTHPYGEWSTQQLTDSPRYAELIERTQWWGRQMLIWGVHVHVGIDRQEKVLPIVNALLAYYPHLLALSASSPMWSGTDTGYASNRAMMFQQLPTAGLPFQFSTWDQFEAFVADQKTTGIIDDINEVRWDIRPSPRLGTVEVRVCDGVSSPAELGAIVALIHCLVVDLDDHFMAGTLPREMAPWLVQENKWRAARYGLDAVIITDADCSERLVTDDLADIVERLSPVAERLGCATELASVTSIITGKGSYQRQRAVLERTGRMADVVAAVVAELDRG